MKKCFYVLLVIVIFTGIAAVYSKVDGNQLSDVSENQSVNNPKEMVGKDGAQMLLIPAGEFQMGSNKGADDEKPVHTVNLNAFYMDKYEVTNAQYKRFVKETGHREPKGRGFINGEFQDNYRPWLDRNFNGDDQPVIYVTWEDANAYAKWADKRLPTESEWEKAARGGLDGKEYAWGDKWLPPDGMENLADESGMIISPKWRYISGYDDGYAYTALVGSFKPNDYGLYDMNGNVREWCNDWYDREYYTKSPEQNPMGPASGDVCVVRGSNWYDFDPYRIRVAKRSACNPSACNGYTGFRCVISAPQ